MCCRRRTRSGRRGAGAVREGRRTDPDGSLHPLPPAGQQERGPLARRRGRPGGVRGRRAGQAVGKPARRGGGEAVEGRKPAMPKEGAALSAEQVETLRRWVAEGATWPKGVVLKEAPKAGADWWSLRPVAKVEPPKTEGIPPSWSSNPIDRFVFAGLKAKGLEPSPPAEKRVIIRRLTYDLTGLPPTPRGDRRVRGGPVAALVRGDRRSPAGVAPLRRALGPALARRRPLRRKQRLRTQRPHPDAVAVPRLRHPRLQRRSAVRSARASNIWPATWSAGAIRASRSAPRSSSAGRTTTSATRTPRRPR